MDVIDQLRQSPIRVDEALRKFARVRCRVAQTLDARHFRQILQQQREIRRLAVAHRASIRVHVLAQQRDFLHTLAGEAGYFREHVVEAAGNFFAPGVRHDAEAAILAAAFHDRDKGGDALDSRRRHGVELLHFRKRDIDLRPAAESPCLDQLRQAMQGLRTEHDIHVRGAVDDDRTFLARHAAADADDELRTRLLQLAQAAKGVKHALLRVFPDRAGIEQDDIGQGGIVGLFERFGRVQDVGHLVRVVLVHLAAVSADIKLFHSVASISAVESAPLLRHSAAICWTDRP